jgi:hypothetical protein
MSGSRRFPRGTSVLGALLLVTANCSETASPRAWTDASLFDRGGIPKQKTQVVAAVVVSLDSTSLAVPHSAQAKAVVLDQRGATINGKTPTWVSSNSQVASVSSTGTVAALAPGSAVISAIVDTVKGTAPITVFTLTVTAPVPAPVAVVDVSLASSTINVGQTTQGTAITRDSAANVLTGRSIVWASSDSAVATVSSSGVVTAIAAGSARIAAISEGRIGSATLTSVAITTSGTGGTTGAALSGSVLGVNGAPVGGGTIDILSGSTIVQSVAVGINGSYSIANLPVGTYNARLNPPLTHSMGPSEPAMRPVTVSSAPATQNFVVQPALYADDFQSYSTAQLTGGDSYVTGSMPSGYFFAGPGRDISIISKPRITMDATGGPFGDKAARYDWAANPYVSGTNLTTYCSSGPTVSLIPRFNPPPAIKNLWVRFTSKESSAFEHGSASCLPVAGLAYKFFLVQIYNSTSFAQYGTYLGNSVSGQSLPTGLYANMSDRSNLSSAQTGLGGIGTTWGGGWHTWVMEILDVGSSSTTFNVYMDGVLKLTMSGPILPGNAMGAGWALALDIGSIINNGPDHAQSRWFRELGVYTTRPSFQPLVK